MQIRCIMIKKKPNQERSIQMSWHQLRHLRKELSYLNDQRLETFALQLQREDHSKVYPQFTCCWYIQGLQDCCETWQHQSNNVKRPTQPVQKPETAEKVIGIGYRKKSRAKSS